MKIEQIHLEWLGIACRAEPRTLAGMRIVHGVAPRLLWQYLPVALDTLLPALPSLLVHSVTPRTSSPLLTPPFHARHARARLPSLKFEYQALFDRGLTNTALQSKCSHPRCKVGIFPSSFLFLLFFFIRK